MSIVINGSGTVTGISVGGLPDGIVDAGTVAADVATQAEIDAKLNLAGGTMTGTIAGFTSTGIDDNANATAISIDANERVGIGIASLSAPLQIRKRLSSVGQTTPETVLLLETDAGSGNMAVGNGTRILFKIADDETNPSVGASIDAVRADGDDSISSTDLVFSTSQNDETLDEALRIDSDGKVGIGTTSPDEKLHVMASSAGSVTGHSESSIVAERAGNSFINILGEDNSGLLFGDDSGNEKGRLYYNFTGNHISIFTNNSERVRIDGSGCLLVGTTSNASINGGGVSINAGSYGAYAMKVNHSAATGDGYGIMVNIPNYSGSGGQYMMRFYTASGSPGSIKSNQSSTSYNTSSDYRLKENVNYTWDATTRLKQLKPCRFNWIIDSTNTPEDGFLAHEVSSIVPNAVSGTKDATETLTNVVLKANGVFEGDNITEAEWEQGKIDDEYPSDSTWVASHTQDINQEMDQSKLVPLLVKTIQELEARITILENP